MTHLGSDVRLLLGSTNRRKIREWRLMLDRIAVELVDPHQLGLAVDAAETGQTPEEDGRIKAMAYYDASGIPAFSLDAALRIEGLPDDQQPGVHVRRIDTDRHTKSGAGSRSTSELTSVRCGTGQVLLGDDGGRVRNEVRPWLGPNRQVHRPSPRAPHAHTRRRTEFLVSAVK